MAEPTSGNEQPEFAPDTEAIEAQEAADKAAADLAESRLAAPADLNEAYKEYDAQGKGEDYEPQGSPTLEAAEKAEKAETRDAAKEKAEAARAEAKASKSKG